MRTLSSIPGRMSPGDAGYVHLRGTIVFQFLGLVAVLDDGETTSPGPALPSGLHLIRD